MFGVQRGAGQHTVQNLLYEDGRVTAVAWTTGNMCMQLGRTGPESQQRWRFNTEICSGLTKVEGEKWLRLKVEKISQLLQYAL